MGRFKDIRGQRFGNLVAVERTGQKNHTASVWKCICDCGNETLVPINYLTVGDTKSCGCMKYKGTPKDISGTKFNKLLAIKRLDSKGSSGDYLWQCKCDCGSITEVPIGRLQSGSAYSCGCDDRRGSHNMYNTKTYTSWAKMLSRCRYDEYGEWYSDVSVCSRWNPDLGGSFENFLEDMGERPEGTSLNRVHGAKIYSPETCEWSDLSMQSFDQKKKSTNTSGRTGVRWRQDREVWIATITKDKQIIQLYYGPSFEEACKTRTEAEIKYFGFSKE